MYIRCEMTSTSAGGENKSVSVVEVNPPSDIASGRIAEVREVLYNFYRYFSEGKGRTEMKKKLQTAKRAAYTAVAVVGMCAAWLIVNTWLIIHPSVIEEPKYCFSFICPLSWNNIAGGMMDADRDFSVNTKLIGSASLNIEGQAKAIRDAIKTKPDGIITTGMENNQALKDAIDAAADAGIPVVLLDSDLPQTKRVAYTGSDNVKLGEMVADELIRIQGQASNVCLIVSNLSSVNQEERIRGFEEKISTYPGIHIAGVIECNSEPLDVQEQYLRFAKAHPDITAVCCLEGRSSIAIGYVLENYIQEEKQTPIVIAVDYSTIEGDFPQEGIYRSVINQNRRYQGYLAVQKLAEYLDGKPVDGLSYTDIVLYHEDEFEKIKKDEKVESYEWNIYEN